MFLAFLLQACSEEGLGKVKDASFFRPGSVHESVIKSVLLPSCIPSLVNLDEQSQQQMDMPYIAQKNSRMQDRGRHAQTCEKGGPHGRTSHHSRCIKGQLSLSAIH